VDGVSVVRRFIHTVSTGCAQRCFALPLGAAYGSDRPARPVAVGSRPGAEYHVR